jgi:hypothetical protein
MPITRPSHHLTPFAYVDTTPLYAYRLRSQQRRNYSDTKRRPRRKQKHPEPLKLEATPSLSRSPSPNLLWPPHLSPSPSNHLSPPPVPLPIPRGATPPTPSSSRRVRENERLVEQRAAVEPPSAILWRNPQPIPVFQSSPSPSSSDDFDPNDYSSIPTGDGDYITVWDQGLRPNRFVVVKVEDNCDCLDWLPEHWHPEGSALGKKLVYKD